MYVYVSAPIDIITLANDIERKQQIKSVRRPADLLDVNFDRTFHMFPRRLGINLRRPDGQKQGFWAGTLKCRGITL